MKSGGTKAEASDSDLKLEPGSIDGSKEHGELEPERTWTLFDIRMCEDVRSAVMNVTSVEMGPKLYVELFGARFLSG